MPLSAAADRAIANNTQSTKSRQPLAANVRPFQGSIMGSTVTGFLRTLTGGDLFFGVAERTADLDDVSTVDAGLNWNIDRGIQTGVVPLTGVVRADVGKNRNVYASDDGTFTFTPTGNTWIGNVVGIAGTNLAVVQMIPHHFLPPAPGSLGLRDLADAAVTLTVADLNKIIRQANTVARAVTLPPAADCGGQFVTIVKNSAAAAAITITGNGAELIDGSNTLATAAARDRITLVSDGTGWTRVA